MQLAALVFLMLRIKEDQKRADEDGILNESENDWFVRLAYFLFQLFLLSLSSNRLGNHKLGRKCSFLQSFLLAWRNWVKVEVSQKKGGK